MDFSYCTTAQQGRPESDGVLPVKRSTSADGEWPYLLGLWEHEFQLPVSERCEQGSTAVYTFDYT